MEAAPQNLDVMAEKVNMFQPVNDLVTRQVDIWAWFIGVSLVLVLLTRHYLMAKTVVKKDPPVGGAARRLTKKPGERRKSLVMGKQGTAEFKPVNWFGIVIGGIITGGAIAFFVLF